MSQSGIGVGLNVYQHELSSAPGVETIAPDVFPAFTSQKWKTLGEVIDLDFSGPDATEIDTKHLGLFRGYKDSIRGFRDGGVVTLRMNYINSTLARVLYLFKDFLISGTGSGAQCINTIARCFDVVIPSSACGGAFDHFSFYGILKTGALEVPEDDRMIQNVEIEVFGSPGITFADGTTVMNILPGSLPVDFV